MRQLVLRFLRKFWPRRRGSGPWHLYEGKDYLAAYAEHTDLRVAANPKAAVGGMWDRIGRLQFDFLVRQGLRPEHCTLDIGCGTLRGGRHFISYLDKGNYVGIDISPKAIEAAEALVVGEGLSDKEPKLILNRTGDLSFDVLEGREFDYILAHSVFTHLMEEHIEACFDNIHKIMHEETEFYFTFFEAPEPTQLSPKDFAYPIGFFQAIATQRGVRLETLSDAYPHPRNQKMVMARLSDAG